jgi:hypothetical protein
LALFALNHSTLHSYSSTLQLSPALVSVSHASISKSAILKLRHSVVIECFDLISILLLRVQVFPEPLVVFLVEDELLEQQVSVILLTHVLYLQLRVLLHQSPILIIYLLCYLSHSFQVLIQFLLLLLKIILVFLLLLCLRLQLQLQVLQLLIQSGPDLRPLLQ